MVGNGEHAGLSVAINGLLGHAFNDFFRPKHVVIFGLPVVNTMASHLVSFVDDALNDVGCVRSKVAGAEECGLHAVGFQDV